MIFKGVKEVMKMLEKAKKERVERVWLALLDGGLLIHETAITSIQQITGSSAQMRYNPRRAVVVSNPGDPPNSDTGRLVKSIRIKPSKSKMRILIGSDLNYAKILEEHPRHARPWLRPAVKQHEKNIRDAIEKAFKR